MNLDELSFLDSEEGKDKTEDFEAMLEKEKENVQRILQGLEPNRLKEN